MRGFNAVSPAFWTSGSGKRLRGNVHARFVALYLITCPSANMLGLYYLPLVTLCHETGLTADEARAALAACAEASFAFYDEVAELAWIPNHAEKDIGVTMAPKDRRRPVVLRELERHAAHPFARAFLSRYGDAYGIPPMPHPRISDAPSTHAEAPRSGEGQGSGSESGSDAGAREGTDAPPSSRASGDGGFAADGWIDGVRSVTGGRPTLAPWERSALGEIARDRPPDANPSTWGHAEGESFARRQLASEPRLLVTADKYLDWVGSGRPGPHARPGPGGSASRIVVAKPVPLGGRVKRMRMLPDGTEVVDE